jgi:hypothetical protein
MDHDPEPTEEGKRRYPAYVDNSVDPPVTYAAGYNHAFEPRIPCTCKTTCHARCAGECGCEACKMVFAEYADLHGWHGPKDDQQGPTFEKQLAQFRGEAVPHTLADNFEHFMSYSGLAVKYADQPDVVSDLLLAYGHGSEGGPADDSNAPVLPDQVDELRRQLLAGEISWYPKPSAAEK